MQLCGSSGQLQYEPQPSTKLQYELSTRGSYCSFAGVLARVATHGNTVLTAKRRAQAQRCLLFAGGAIVVAQATSVDVRADLAVMQCTGLYTQPNARNKNKKGSRVFSPPSAPLPFVELCEEGSALAAALSAVPHWTTRKRGRNEREPLDILCIGQSTLARIHT